MIVTVGSVAGSPGVTSWAMLLAAAWPDPTRERVLLEANLDGGVLAYRYRQGTQPGAVSLVAAISHLDPAVALPVVDHGVAVGAGDVWLVPGPETGEGAQALWRGTAEQVAARLAADVRVWLVDVGRLALGDATAPFAHHARLALVVTGPTVEHLVAVGGRVAGFAAAGVAVAVLVVGRCAYDTDELVANYGTPLVWRVDDVKQLPALAGALQKHGRERRHSVWGDAVTVAGEIAAVVDDARFVVFDDAVHGGGS
jgi:hypothetical protein